MAPRQRFYRGFTLIEILVVVAIIGVLATIGSAYMRSPKDRADDVQALASMRQIAALIEQEAVASPSGVYLAMSAPAGPTADDDSWALLLAAFPSQAAQLPPVGQGYAVESDATGYCLWKVAKVDPAKTLFCEVGARCSDKEGVDAGSLPASCGHPAP